MPGMPPVGGGRLVRAAWENARSEHPGGSSAGPDVGHRAAAAPGVSWAIRRGVIFAYWSGNPGAVPDTPPELTHLGDRRVTRHLYGRQTRDGEVIFGGDRQLVGYDRTVDATGVEANFAHTAEVLPFLNGVAISRTWSGLMPFSLDGKPIIGKIPQAGKPVHRHRAGFIRVWPRPHGRQVDRRLPAQRPPSAGAGGV